MGEQSLAQQSTTVTLRQVRGAAKVAVRCFVAGSRHRKQQASGNTVYVVKQPGVDVQKPGMQRDAVAKGICRTPRLATGQTATIEACAMRCEDVDARARLVRYGPTKHHHRHWRRLGNMTDPSPHPSPHTIQFGIRRLHLWLLHAFARMYMSNNGFGLSLSCCAAFIRPIYIGRLHTRPKAVVYAAALLT